MTRVSGPSAGIALAFVLWLGGSVVGCHSGKEPPRGAFEEPRPVAERAEPRPTVRFIDTPDPPAREAFGLKGEEDDVDEEPERNLSEELRAAIGSPAGCLAGFEASSPTTLRIPVSATIRPTGMVIQPSVPGPNVPVEARRCIEQRVTLVKLAPLSSPLSETVSTVLEFNYTPPEVVTSEGTAEPELRNVKDPLPKRPEVAPSGRPIQAPTSIPIDQRAGRDPNGPTGRPIRGPKPRAIDGYEVDENAQQWR